MLRSTRGLLLLAIVAILVAVGAAYYRQKRTLARDAPTAPKSLPLNTDAAASDWVYRKEEGGHTIVEVRAKQFRSVNNPDRVELDDVELRLYKGQGAHYDLVHSARAFFDPAQGLLYSEGDVDITMGMADEGAAAGRLLKIQSSGVTFDSKTGKATTDRLATFTFDQGDGRAVGASYDPNLRELVMRSQVELNWRGRGPKSRPMELEAGEATYKERESRVLLSPWSRIRRGGAVLEAGEAVVMLDKSAIRSVDAKSAHGADQEPHRNLEYAADQLHMDFAQKGEIEKIVGEPNARLVSTTEAARTTTTARRVELTFDAGAAQSTLSRVLATGNAVMESAPLPRQDVLPSETRKLTSDVVLLRMRPGGREIDNVETQAAGHLEFLPNRAGQRHRTLDADRMTMVYGSQNRLRAFRATNAATRTEPAANDPKKKPPPPVETWSKDLSADFDDKGQLARLEQWNDFRYQEGDRQARALRATLEEARNLITLDGQARAWDTSGSTTADRILLDQKSGDMWAQGNVISTRLPDPKKKPSGMLSEDQPLQATADRMQTRERNQKVHYEGHAVAWQGANRIRADAIDIDRAARRLTAHGNVHTQLVDSPKPAEGAAAQAPKKPPGAPVVITVDAPGLVYTDADRLAFYSGGAHLVRPGMDVRGGTIRAWLADPNDKTAEHSLDHAFADGKVRIVRTEQGGRTLTTDSEHAEFYARDQHIVINGGQPTLEDSLRGSTRGSELIYYVENDKLLVNGLERQPVRSLIRRH